MSENWFIEAISSRWFPAVFAYLLGIATGWAVWGLLRPASSPARQDDEAAVNALDSSLNLPDDSEIDASAKIGEKLNDLETEITNAKTLLEQETAENDAFSEMLENLDQAIKRANGRLKVIAKSLRLASKNE